MLELRNPRIAIPVVLFAGLLWSFGPLVVRYMDNPQFVPWQYIFGRGLTIFILLNLYLFFDFYNDRYATKTKYKKYIEQYNKIHYGFKNLHDFYDAKQIFGRQYRQTYAEFLDSELKYAS